MSNDAHSASNGPVNGAAAGRLHPVLTLDQSGRSARAAKAKLTMTNANRLLIAFYGGVALVALAGQTGAAMNWLRWPLVTALPAVALLELGGIALAAYGDARRRLAERALAARLLSAVIAMFAVAFNWVGHQDRIVGGFFALMSGIGYALWLLTSEARRRDQLRADGNLADPPPVYPLTQWLRHPWITRRARHMAKADPALGLYGSLAAAQEAMGRELRNAKLAEALRQRVAAAVDPTMADIAVLTYDLDELAVRLRASADYGRLTALLAADLDPARLAAGRPRRRGSRWQPETPATPQAEASAATRDPPRSSARRHTRRERPRPGEAKDRMREYAAARLAAGEPITGAALDREFGTRDYGRRVLRELTETGGEQP